LTLILKSWALGPLVAATTLVAFLPALDAGFLNWDDGVNILDNHAFRGLGWHNLKWMFTTTLLAVYAPLAWLSLGVNYVLGGMDPWGYHLGNVLLHGANAGLFYLVARRLLAAAFDPRVAGEGAVALGAVFAALAFGVHPLRVESVAWVTERRDVLCGTFYLLAVLAHLRGVSGGGLVEGRWRVLSVSAFAAALLSKGLAMTLPLTLLVLDVYPLRRLGLGWPALLREKIPHAVLAILAAVVALVAVGRGSTWTDYGNYGLGARVAMVGYSLWFYPSKMLWPVDLSPLYELPVGLDPMTPRFGVPVILVGAVSVALVMARRRLPGALAAWAHSVIVLAPVSGIVHAGNQLAHDRFSYLSGLGFATLLGAAGTWAVRAWLTGRLGSTVGALAAGAAVLALLGWGAGTWRQSKVWHDSESLWRAAVAADEQCAMCHNNLASAIVLSPAPSPARLAEAESHLRNALALRQDQAYVYLNLGALLAREGRYDEAEPYLAAYRRMAPGVADGPAVLGMLYVDQRRFREAVPLLREALRLRPGMSVARGDLARALEGVGQELERTGRTDEAVVLLREVAELRAGTSTIPPASGGGLR
jgi:hypothetical protein